MSRPATGTLVRALGSLLLALIVATGLPAAANAATTAAAVTWQKDDAAKTITANVRITLTPACTQEQLRAAASNQAMKARCTVTDQIAKAVKDNIEKVWNGHRYYCYELVVRVDVTADNTPGSTDPTDRVVVRIDQSPVPVRSFVNASSPANTPWWRDYARDKLAPVNDGPRSSTWRYPAVTSGDTSQNVYAHEAGHVMGLHDTYDDYTAEDGESYSRPKEGAPSDIMNDTETSTVDQATINRMLGRAGFHRFQLRCNYRIDLAAMGGTIKGRKCDPPLGAWTAHQAFDVSGSKGDQVWRITITTGDPQGGVFFSGTFTYTVHSVTKKGGVTVTVDGKAAGTAELTIDDGLRAHMRLQETSHTYTATSDAGGKGSAQNAPLAAIDHVWEPIGRCE